MADNQMRQFNEELLEEVNVFKKSEICSTEDAFTHVFSTYIIEAGESSLNDLIVKSYKKDYEKAKINGYVYNEYFHTLTLVVTIFENKTNVKKMGKTDVAKYSKKAVKFFRMCKDGYFEDVDETDPGYIISEYINSINSDIEHLDIILLTNCDAVFEIPEPIQIGNIHVKFDLWDLDRVWRFVFKKKSHEDLVIKFAEKYNSPLKMIKVEQNNDVYECYIGVISGQCLAEIYRDKGQRLIEKNVRSFLQATGKINKGIKETLQTAPHMFMSYNNGISTTAKNIVIDSDKSNESFVLINEITDWQIVNGGQTTASIYNALKSGVNISEVNIQMKLTVIVDEAKTEDLVSNISKYANSQNKINLSDFSANDDYHIEMERFSREVYVPVSSGKPTQRWYYERARGGYLVEVNRQPSATEKKKFKENNPKSMCVSKTVAAKCVMSWERYPHIVSKGLETNFIEFTKLIKDGRVPLPSEQTYVKMISKIILFNECDRLVAKQNIIGYKAQINYYTIALLAEYHADKVSDEYIWSHQSISPELAHLIDELIIFVWNHFMHPITPGINITQWCKKEECWTLLKSRYESGKIA